MVNEIGAVDWRETFDPAEDSSALFPLFYSKLSNIIDKHIPLKQLSKREVKIKSKPWITPGLSRSIHAKSNLYKKFIRSKSIYYRERFKLCRNKLNHLLKISKKQYCNDFFRDCNRDGKKIRKGIREIVNCKPSANERTITIAENGKEITDQKEISSKFNNYFANIGKDIASQIPVTSKSPVDYLNRPLCNSFYLFPTSSTEIEREIGKLQSGKAVGPSSLPVNIMKIIRLVISKPLKLIFNASFTTGIVPSEFKVANVIPIFKKGSQYDLCNYRPISLLLVFIKILEKLMYTRLTKFLDKNNVLSKNQFGFRSGHSTQQAILCIIDRIQRAINKRNYSCGIFLDFSKAFDTINHIF